MSIKQFPVSVLTYKVDVYTGNKTGADTQSQVHLCIYGDRGDTGKRLLLPRNNKQTIFNKGKVGTHIDN